MQVIMRGHRKKKLDVVAARRKGLGVQTQRVLQKVSSPDPSLQNLSLAPFSLFSVHPSSPGVSAQAQV